MSDDNPDTKPREDLAHVPCPSCQQNTLVIESRLKMMPFGTHCLSGDQLKVSAVEWPYLHCPRCNWGEWAKTVEDDDLGY